MRRPEPNLAVSTSEDLRAQESEVSHGLLWDVRVERLWGWF